MLNRVGRLLGAAEGTGPDRRSVLAWPAPGESRRGMGRGACRGPGGGAACECVPGAQVPWRWRVGFPVGAVGRAGGSLGALGSCGAGVPGRGAFRATAVGSERWTISSRCFPRLSFVQMPVSLWAKRRWVEHLAAPLRFERVDCGYRCTTTAHPTRRTVRLARCRHLAEARWHRQGVVRSGGGQRGQRPLGQGHSGARMRPAHLAAAIKLALRKVRQEAARRGKQAQPDTLTFAELSGYFDFSTRLVDMSCRAGIRSNYQSDGRPL